MVAISGHFAFAKLDLGRINEYKLQSFEEYFKNFLEHGRPRFHSEEFEQKIIQEAEGIYAWMDEPASWPDVQKITPSMQKNAAKLLTYFSYLELESAREKAIEYFERIVEKDPADVESQETCLLFARHPDRRYVLSPHSVKQNSSCSQSYRVSDI